MEAHPHPAHRRCAYRATPTEQAIEFHRALGEHGVPTEVIIYPLEGPRGAQPPTQVDLATRIVTWFERYMPPGTGAR